MSTCDLCALRKEICLLTLNVIKSLQGDELRFEELSQTTSCNELTKTACLQLRGTGASLFRCPPKAHSL